MLSQHEFCQTQLIEIVLAYLFFWLYDHCKVFNFPVEKLVENWHLEPISDEDLMGLEIRQRCISNYLQMTVVHLPKYAVSL